MVSKKSKLVRGSKCVLAMALASLAATAVLPGCAAEGATDEDVAEATEAVSIGDYAGWARYSKANGLNVNDSFNSTGGGITVTNPSVGSYTVEFAGLGEGAVKGNVQVTSVGWTGSRCKASTWTTSGTKLRVGVLCHYNGSLSDDDFLVSYARFAGGNAVHADGAYVRSTSLSAETPPDVSFQWGSASTIEHIQTGQYWVIFPGQSISTGMIVTALGRSSSYCKLAGLVNVGIGARVEVRCFTDAGEPVDSTFSLRLAREMRDSHRYSGGYALANNPTAADYTPIALFQQNHATTECGVISNTNTVHKTGVGSWTVTYPRLATRAAAFVTAYSDGPEFCKPVSWATSGDGQAVKVHCFGSNGALTNVMYDSVLFSQYYFLC